MTVGGSTAEMKSWEKGMYEHWFRSKSKFSSLYSWTDDFTNPWLDGGRQKQIRIKPCSLSIRINPSKFNHGSMRSSLLSKVVGWGRTEWVWKRHGWTRMDWCGLISTNSNGQLMAQKRTGNGCGFIWSNRGRWTNAVGWRKNSTIDIKISQWLPTNRSPSPWIRSLYPYRKIHFKICSGW